MRKVLLMTAVAALLLGSCSDDKEIGITPAENGGAIDFRAFTDKGTATKTTITTTDNILGFTVTGWWNKVKDDTRTHPTAADYNNQETGDYLFNAVEIARRESGITSWSYDPVRYWPKKGAGVFFYAYSPASSINVKTGIHNYTGKDLAYTVPDPKKDNPQEDFLLARTAAKGFVNEVDNTSAVQLSFVHALSRVKFYARTTRSGINYTLSEIALVNVKKSGTIILANIPVDGDLSNLYDDGDVANGTPAGAPLVGWTSTGDFEDVDVDLSKAPAYLDDEFKSLTGESNSLMVLPQTTVFPTDAGGDNIDKSPVSPDDKDFSTYFDEDAFYIKVGYRAFDLDNFYYAGSPDEPKVLYFSVADAIRSDYNGLQPFTFEMGRQYNFRMTFGTDAGNPIRFDVSVSDWTDNPGLAYSPENLVDLIDKKLLIGAKFLDTDGTTVLKPITSSAVEAVTDLPVAISKNDYSLTGLEYFTGITALHLEPTEDMTSINIKETIDLTQNAKLKTFKSGKYSENYSPYFTKIIVPDGLEKILDAWFLGYTVETLVVWDGYESGSGSIKLMNPNNVEVSNINTPNIVTISGEVIEEL